MTIRCEQCRKELDVCSWDVPPQGVVCNECCEKNDKEKVERKVPNIHDLHAALHPQWNPDFTQQISGLTDG